MKKIISSLLAVMLFVSINAQQDDKYTLAMQSKVAAIDTLRKPAELIELSAAFERIADAEKTKWQPYYYAALAQVNAGYAYGQQGEKAEKTDPLADKAEAFINKADALSPNNSEIYVIKKMIATLRMMPDPMTRYQTYLPQAEEALAVATKLNADNPRVYILKGQDQFYTPEQFGGSKTEAKKLFETAEQKFGTFKPATALDPNWGRGQIAYFISQIK